MYLTFEEYGAYGGSIRDTAEFERLEYRARKFVDQMTCCRIRDETPVRECVKRLTYELIGVMQSQAEAEQRRAAGVASQSNDGISVSYATGTATGQSNAAADVICQQLAVQYLCGETDASGVCLLYRGVGK